jgi:hypothetical protein
LAIAKSQWTVQQTAPAPPDRPDMITQPTGIAMPVALARGSG